MAREEARGKRKTRWRPGESCAAAVRPLHIGRVLTCVHHIQWIREVPGGLHQCIQCFQVVAKKDVYPKLEDLPEEVQRRWDAHEATRGEAAGAAAPGAKQR